jgi:hypothetical protein
MGLGRLRVGVGKGNHMRAINFLQVVGAALLITCDSTPNTAQTQQKPANDLEEIYIAHSIRISTTVPPTAFATMLLLKEEGL